MRFITILTLVFILSIKTTAQAYVVIKTPLDGAVYLSVSDSLVTVMLSYDLLADSRTDGAAFCFHITNEDARNLYSENCFKVETKEIAINEVSVGNYTLTSFLRELDPSTQNAKSKIKDTLQTISFTVKSYESVIPVLDVKSDQCEGSGGTKLIAIPVDPKSKTATAGLHFILAARELPVDSFRICLSIEVLGGATVVEEMCLPPGELLAEVRNLPVSTYTLRAGLRETKGGDAIPSSKITASLEIYALRNAVKSVHIAEQAGLTRGSDSGQRLEFVVDSHSNQASTPFTVVLQTSPCSAEQLISVCLELRGLSAESILLLPRTCLAPTARTLTPQRVPAGSFVALITLHDSRLLPTDADATLPLPVHQTDASRSVRVLIETRPQEELVPSYDWQRLHAWHTIPAGMDVRLPLGGSGHKEARIPQPWRLHALLPRGCQGASFLRMDLTRHSTVGDVRRRAEELCRSMPGRYSVYGNGAAIGPDEATVEDVMLFQKKVHIVYDS